MGFNVKMKKKLNVGLMGLSFKSGNLGCVALAISFYTGIVEVLEKLNLDCKILAIGAVADTREYVNERYPIEFLEYHLSNPKSFFKAFSALKTCDIIFDFTEGDSFSDIYGRARFYRSVALKCAIERTRVPLVLGPQTYGPFTKLDCRYFAKQILKNAHTVYSRDENSKIYLQNIGITKKIVLSTDVAFRLPYSKTRVAKDDGIINVGINVSGLLWDNAVKNALGLTVDYVDYCKQIIRRLCNNNSYRVYLIPHVGTKINEMESDYSACYSLHKGFNECILLNGYMDPIKAKSELANMDIVIAARMHASIGAFSSGVFTIPFAYSRKFEGYYGRLGYPILIDGKKESTETAVEKTLTYIKEYKNYSKIIIESHSLAESMLSCFYNDITTIIQHVTVDS